MDAPGKPAMDIEEHNHRQIEMLNQRGGRTLSIVDLLLAGTISVEMAAYAMRAMKRGASLLTGARPGSFYPEAVRRVHPDPRFWVLIRISGPLGRKKEAAFRI